VETVILVLTSIGGGMAAPVLVRAAIAARDWQGRELAFNGVAWPVFDFKQRPGRPWEACLRNESAYACPFDSEAPRVAAAVTHCWEMSPGTTWRRSRSAGKTGRGTVARSLGAWSIEERG